MIETKPHAMKIINRLLVKACIEEINPQIETLSQLFYKELFHLDIQLKDVFQGNVAFLNRKFINLLATLKNVKHLESISDSIAKMGERHADYGTQIKHFPTVKKALLHALKELLKDRYNEKLDVAWNDVFDEVAALMEQALANVDATSPRPVKQGQERDETNLLEDIGGEEVVLRVHQRFYDVIFEDRWLETFFYGKSKETLVRKQTEFMAAAFNGPNHDKGDTPAFVHMHMFITDEMADIRETLLRNAILQEGLSADIADRWLKIDQAFRPGVVKKSVDECVLKCKGQMPISAKKPPGYKPPRPYGTQA